MTTYRPERIYYMPNGQCSSVSRPEWEQTEYVRADLVPDTPERVPRNTSALEDEIKDLEYKTKQLERELMAALQGTPNVRLQIAANYACALVASGNLNIAGYGDGVYDVRWLSETGLEFFDALIEAERSSRK